MSLKPAAISDVGGKNSFSGGMYLLSLSLSLSFILIKLQRCNSI